MARQCQLILYACSRNAHKSIPVTETVPFEDIGDGNIFRKVFTFAFIPFLGLSGARH